MDEHALALREELRAYARARGADSIGITSAEAFDAQVPNKQKSSTTALGWAWRPAAVRSSSRRSWTIASNTPAASQRWVCW